jgi:hypothetical protein
MTTKRFQAAGVWMLVGVLTGCTTLEPVQGVRRGGNANAAAIRTHLSVGDEVKVTTQDGHQRELKITALGATSLTGTSQRANSVRSARPVVEIAYDQISGMEVRGYSAAATWSVAAAVGLAVLVGSVYALCTTESCKKGF